MDKQHLLTPGRLLDASGKLAEAGYSARPIRIYARGDIKASKWRVKEWDYYYVGDAERGVAFTISDLGYISLVSASALDFVGKKFKTTSEIKFFSFGKIAFPPSTDGGDVEYRSKRVFMKFFNDGATRKLICNFKNFARGEDLEAELTLGDFPRDAMVIATPFADNDKAFYYNSKINCMSATGYVKLGEDIVAFDSARAMGILDWGRGVWTYKNTWYWGSLNAFVGEKKLGLNLGYGFGDTSAASENMIFVDGIAHKLGNVRFEIPQKDGRDDFLSPWKIRDDEGRLDLTFEPILDRKDITDIGVIASKQHQIFGRYGGKVRLDDYSELEFRDKVGFAEKVYNKW